MAVTLAALDLASRIAQQTTVLGVWKVYFEAAKLVGFTSGVASLVPAALDSPSSLFGCDLPDGWGEYYAKQGYAAVDTVAARALLSRHPFEWNAGDWQAAQTPLEQCWRDHVAAMNCFRGYLIPDCSAGDVAAISLAGDYDVLEPHDRMKLHFAGIEALARMREIGIAPAVPIGKPLSSRECECLKWLAAGKTDWEIGMILSLSEKTVNVYIDRAKHKLGVQTRVQAVAKAVRERFIND